MNASKKSERLRTLVSCALLVALEVILGRWFAIRTPMVNISFAFVPLALSGLLYGPGYGFAVGGIADFIGAMLFPQGPYFPGFTLTNALCGMTHGFLLHQKSGMEQSQRSFFVRTVISVLIVNLGWQMCLNTFWLTVIGATSKGFWVLVGTRLTKYLIMAPVQILVITLVKNTLAKPLLRLRTKAAS